jgi:hypothetical protein
MLLPIQCLSLAKQQHKQYFLNALSPVPDRHPTLLAAADPPPALRQLQSPVEGQVLADIAQTLPNR